MLGGGARAHQEPRVLAAGPPRLLCEWGGALPPLAEDLPLAWRHEKAGRSLLSLPLSLACPDAG